MKIIIKTPQEIEIMKEGGKILADVLQIVSKMAKPGVTTEELNLKAEEEILKRGAMPSFKDYVPEDNKDLKYPAALCVSINDAVVHGIPNETKIQEGDVVGLDLGVEYKGLYTDAAVTVIVENSKSEKHKKIVETTKKCLDAGISKIKPGAQIGDVSAAIQKVAESAGFSVVRDLVGHGVGKFVHEPPEIPNYGNPRTGIILKEGMTLALEPMICIGSHKVELLDDDWTVVTKDGSVSAHFEHTVAITGSGVKILTQ